MSIPKKRNKNLQIVADFTIYGYAYVRQVACGDRKNELISRAIKAANDNDFEELLKIKNERQSELDRELTAIQLPTQV